MPCETMQMRRHDGCQSFGTALQSRTEHSHPWRYKDGSVMIICNTSSALQCVKAILPVQTEKATKSCWPWHHHLANIARPREAAAAAGCTGVYLLEKVIDCVKTHHSSQVIGITHVPAAKQEVLIPERYRIENLLKLVESRPQFIDGSDEPVLEFQARRARDSGE